MSTLTASTQTEQPPAPPFVAALLVVLFVACSVWSGISLVARLLTSGGPTELTSTDGGIHFALATDDHSSTHEKSSSNSNWVSSDTKGDITQTLHGVEIESATPVIVNAANGVQVDIEHLDNADVSQMIDATGC